MLIVSRDFRSDDVEKPSKVHRHCLPTFVRSPKLILARRIFARIDRHNWRQNEYAIQSRLSNCRRVAIRSEKRETLHAICKALVFYTCFDPKSPHQFECWADIPFLAKQINAMYQVENSGYEYVRYDSVLNALKELESMEAVLCVREYCHISKRNKLSRVFLMPVFFRMFGFKDTETFELLKANKKAMQLPEDKRVRTEQLWAKRIGNGVRAQIRSKAAKRRIDQARRQFSGLPVANDNDILSGVVKEMRDVTGHESFKGKLDLKPSKVDQFSDRETLRKFFSVGDLHFVRSKLVKDFPDVDGESLEMFIDDELRQLLPGHFRIT
ncbi:MAG: hypothetical protein ACI90R_002129 [Alteromonas macleodii]|jgi:hypothetical protein